MSMEKVINSYELTGRIGLLRSNKSFSPERRKLAQVVKKEFPADAIRDPRMPRENITMTTTTSAKGKREYYSTWKMAK